MIYYQAENISMPKISKRKGSAWIKEVASRHGFRVGEISYIFCDDEKIFGKGETCISNPGNFYIAWNGISNKGRLVGSGVYISSFSWYIQIGNYANRATRMDSFGLRRKN